MSKLPKAPLIEVIFEVRWPVISKNDLAAYQYMVGDLYSLIKNDYPVREFVNPPDIPLELLINHPVHRFKQNEKAYPLIQLGPGVLTLNITDEDYFWDNFYEMAKVLSNHFFSIKPELIKQVKPQLLYLDFFKFDFEKEDAYRFVNENFNMKLSQGFIKETNIPFNLDIGFFYPTDKGKLSVTLKRGQDSSQSSGIIMQTSLSDNSNQISLGSLLNWLGDAHQLCSSTFKEITKGRLYDSFT